MKYNPDKSKFIQDRKYRATFKYKRIKMLLKKIDETSRAFNIKTSLLVRSGDTKFQEHFIDHEFSLGKIIDRCLM